MYENVFIWMDVKFHLPTEWAISRIFNTMSDLKVKLGWRPKKKKKKKISCFTRWMLFEKHKSLIEKIFKLEHIYFFLNPEGEWQ